MIETCSLNQYTSAIFVPCIFCTEKDLFMHMEAFSVEGVQHLEKWKRTHANLEGHYGEEE